MASSSSVDDGSGAAEDVADGVEGVGASRRERDDRTGSGRGVGDEQRAVLLAGQGRTGQGVDALTARNTRRHVERGVGEAGAGDEVVGDDPRGLGTASATQAGHDGDVASGQGRLDGGRHGSRTTQDDHLAGAGGDHRVDRVLRQAATVGQEDRVLALVGQRTTGEGVREAGAGGDQTDRAGRRGASLDDLLGGGVAVRATEAGDREAGRAQLRLHSSADGDGATDDGDVLRAGQGVQARQHGGGDAVALGQQDRNALDTGEEVGRQRVDRAAGLATGEDRAGRGTELGSDGRRGLVAVLTRHTLESETGTCERRRCGSDSARERESTGENASSRTPHGRVVDLAQRRASCSMRWQSRAALTWCETPKWWSGARPPSRAPRGIQESSVTVVTGT